MRCHLDKGNCKAYKNIHYKNDNQFCLKCGNPLSYICTKYWKVMKNNKKEFFINYEVEKEQKRAQASDKV